MKNMACNEFIFMNNEPHKLTEETGRMENLGKQIQQRRRRVGITQTRLAELSGVSLSLIGKLEAGIQNNPTVSKLDAIERALDKLERAMNIDDGKRGCCCRAKKNGSSRVRKQGN
jgi:DNA-binding XRE family transcriptional regulator